MDFYYTTFVLFILEFILTTQDFDNFEKAIEPKTHQFFLDYFPTLVILSKNEQ